jgi:hypothetical protein
MRERVVLTMEAAMARMFPAVCPTMKDGVAIAPAERQLFARLARELDAKWQVVHDCRVVAGVESGALDFVLIHRDYGIALLGVAVPGGSGDPEIAVAAMRAKLARIGFAERYRGHLAIVARSVMPGAVSDLAAFLALRFAAAPASAIADPTWTDWLLQRLVAERGAEHAAPEDAAAERLGPARAAAAPVEAAPRAGGRGLRAPTPEDSWRARAADKPAAAAPQMRGAGRSAPPAGVPGGVPGGVKVAAERIAVSRVAETRSPLWTGMALAVVVVSVVLVGIAVLSHGNGGHDAIVTQSASTPPPAPAH